MIFKQVDEILSGKKTQTRRLVKGNESIVGDVVLSGLRDKWVKTRTYAIQPHRTAPGIITHRIKITSLHCERLHEISEADAIAEGVANVDEYTKLWEEINGKKSWDKNPLVWVIEFEAVLTGRTGDEHIYAKQPTRFEVVQELETVKKQYRYAWNRRSYETEQGKQKRLRLNLRRKQLEKEILTYQQRLEGF